MKNKSLFVGMFVVALAVMSVVSVSAVAPTYVTGKVYDSTNFATGTGVGNATVHAFCDQVSGTNMTRADGTYSINFDSLDCPNGATVTAYATKGGITSANMTATVNNFTGTIGIYLSVVNIALVPEFGVLAGTLTLLGAVGIFLFVRRK